MSISEHLTPGRVIPRLRASDKEDLLHRLAVLAGERGIVPDAAALERVLRSREAVLSTGVGNGWAVPHALVEGAEQAAAFLVLLEEGIPFGTTDDEPVEMVFFLVGRPAGSREHLAALASVGRLIRDPSLKEELRAAASPEATVALLCRREGGG